MTNLEFVEILKKITEQTKTQYATGAFGAVVGLYNNRERYAKNSSKSTAAKIMAADPDTFMFDCIKANLFSGDSISIFPPAMVEPITKPMMFRISE